MVRPAHHERLTTSGLHLTFQRPRFRPDLPDPGKASPKSQCPVFLPYSGRLLPPGYARALTGSG